jgi:hypothetical protein
LSAPAVGLIERTVRAAGAPVEVVVAADDDVVVPADPVPDEARGTVVVVEVVDVVGRDWSTAWVTTAPAPPPTRNARMTAPATRRGDLGPRAW